MNNTLALQGAYAQQVRDENENQWIVYSSDGVELERLPSTWHEKEVMGFIRLARKYEELAFKLGQASQDVQPNLVRQLQMENSLLKDMNITLSTKLDDMISKGRIEHAIN